MLRVDKKTYRVKEKDNYIKYKTNKDLIIIGDTSRKGNNHIKRMLYKDFGYSREWNTYTITREGIVYEHFDPKYFSEFSGDENINKRSISILFENMGFLYKENNRFYNWIHEECENLDLIFRKHWKIGYYWEKYTEKQYVSFVELLIRLFKNFKIPQRMIDNNLYYEDSYDYKGVLSCSNLSKEEVDVNPSFDYNKVLSMLKKRGVELIVD